MADVPLIVKKVGHYIQLSEEQLRQWDEDRQAQREAEARWAAMTPQEQARATAEWEAQRAAEKAARTCEHCGCDPDEHGGY